MDTTLWADAAEEETVLFRALDKGIDDMEAGRLTTHEETMREIREWFADYAKQH